MVGVGVRVGVRANLGDVEDEVGEAKLALQLDLVLLRVLLVGDLQR